MATERNVAEHYGRSDLERTILDALRAAGKDADHLTVDDLAPVDEFHVRGRQATVELAEKLGLRGDHHVLDVGCGLGGASRYLAATFGCRVTGIDLTPAYCTLASRFAAATGLAERLEYRCASALSMPVANATFDAAFTQHVAMNIEDKAGLHREVARVLKPGAVFGIYDILRGSGGTVVYPTPWANDPSTSFLATPDEMRALLEAADFRIESWRDTTDLGRAFFEALFARIAADGPPPLGLHLLLPDFAPRARNVLQNLAENRVALVEIVARRQ